jgi:hypothetical protein
MKTMNNTDSQASRAGEVRLNLTGLAFFSAALVLAGGLLAAGLMTWKIQKQDTGSGSRQVADSPGLATAQDEPPWGDLMTVEIEVERPEEYVASEINTNRPPAWVFDQMPPEKARAMMIECGLDSSQVESALSPSCCSITSTGTVVTPGETLLMSLNPKTRAKLYNKLGRSGVNHYMQNPFTYPANRLGEWFKQAKVNSASVARVRKLLYRRGSLECFSDFEFVMRGLPNDEQRLDLVKALSRQPTLLARVHISPKTDVNRVLGYWGRGLQVKDARPLLESLKRQPQGGSISLAFLLPHFVRERLYTYPLPPSASDPVMDCHWSSLNFFNDSPDNRLSNAGYAAEYLKTNYYRVAKPTSYGDIVLVLNDQGNAVHSAVYLADNIVFTKNGNNHMQPWTLMRLKDLLSTYDGEDPARVAVFRRNTY